MSSALVVHDEDDLRQIPQLRRGARVKFALPWLKPDQNRIFEERIHRHLDECGCSMAAAFLLFGIGIALTVDIFVRWYISQHSLAAISIELILVIVLSGLGKFIGIAAARLRLNVTVHRLIAESNSRRCAEKIS